MTPGPGGRKHGAQASLCWRSGGSYHGHPLTPISTRPNTACPRAQFHRTTTRHNLEPTPTGTARFHQARAWYMHHWAQYARASLLRAEQVGRHRRSHRSLPRGCRDGQPARLEGVVPTSLWNGERTGHQRQQKPPRQPNSTNPVVAALGWAWRATRSPGDAVVMYGKLLATLDSSERRREAPRLSAPIQIQSQHLLPASMAMYKIMSVSRQESSRLQFLTV